MGGALVALLSTEAAGKIESSYYTIHTPSAV